MACCCQCMKEFCLCENDDPTDFESIQKRDEERYEQMLFVGEDYRGAKCFKVFWHCRNTIVTTIWFDAQLWLSFGIYFFSRWIEYKKYPLSSPISFAGVGTIGGVMSFLLVFFVADSYSRFQNQWQLVAKISNAVLDVAMTSHAIFKNEAERLQLIRYVNAMHALGYVGLAPIYRYDNFFLKLNEKYRFLTDKEIKLLKETYHTKSVEGRVAAYAVRDLNSWCIQLVTNRFESDLNVNDNRNPMGLNEIIISSTQSIRKSITELTNYKFTPIPFSYLHFLYFMTAFYLPLFAYGIANNLSSVNEESDWQNPRELIGIVSVFLNCVFVLGLRLLGSQLQDPFGNDIFDLPILRTVEFTARHSMRIGDSDRERDPTKTAFASSPEVEKELRKHRDLALRIDEGVESSPIDNPVSSMIRGGKVPTSEN